jgi:hypothetical protein
VIIAFNYRFRLRSHSRGLTVKKWRADRAVHRGDINQHKEG